jgi:hypothetical protein
MIDQIKIRDGESNKGKKILVCSTNSTTTLGERETEIKAHFRPTPPCLSINFIVEENTTDSNYGSLEEEVETTTCSLNLERAIKFRTMD